MIKVLQISPALDGGGIERLLLDYCSRMTSDIQFDFVVSSKTEGILEKPLIELGCRVFHVAQIREDYRQHCKQIKDILQQEQYDIIHDHSQYRAWCNLRVAKKFGVKIRIAHSHQAFMVEGRVQKMERLLSTPMTKHFSTHLFACGEDAARWMWGKRAFEKGKVYIMKNAIHTEQFSFNEQKRENVRRELGLDGKFVIGNVARISYQKNHEFLVQIFAEIKKQRVDAVLMLVGRGELEEEVRRQVDELGLTDSVLFMGVRNDVSDLLNAMDVFVLPSRYEGLGIVYIEAQANGLVCFASSVVPQEANAGRRISYIPLSCTPKEWADQILVADTARSKNVLSSIVKAGYDIDAAAHIMKEKYEILSNRK